MDAEVRRTNGKYEVCLRKSKLNLLKLSRPGEGDARMVKEICSTPSPENGGGSDITCVQLTEDFLIYGTKTGSLFYQYLDASGPCLANEYSHSVGGITRLWPNNAGTRLLFEDDRHSIYLHNPTNDQAILVPVNAGKLDVALWDVGDSLIFVLAVISEIFVYIYSPVNIYCSKVSLLQASALPSGLYPVALQNGTLTCKEDGALESVTIPTHSWLKKAATGTKELRERFDQNLILLHFKEALEDARLIKCPMVWEALIKKSLEQMELEIAMKACQFSGNIRLLMCLHQVEHVEEYNLLAGHMLLLLENFDAAQESFLKSTYPEAAVKMRRDLEHWDQAMTLAKELKSPLEAEIVKEYAHARELAGEYRQALSYYEEFLRSGPMDQKQKYFCQAGVARTCIHLGDIWKGKQLAKECNNSLLYRECASIIEGLNLQKDAAEIYELDGQLEKAVGIYISTKNYSKALPLLQRIASPKFYIVYARAMETERKFEEAAAAYEAAEEHENAVRLYLGPLKSQSKAFSIVRKVMNLETRRDALRFDRACLKLSESC